MSESKAIAMRRIDFLIAEAKAWTDLSKRDLAITFALRAISNYATIDRDGQSFEVKALNRRMSNRAKELLEAFAAGKQSFKDWHIKTRNEHRRPIDCIWRSLLRNPDVDPEAFWTVFVDNPMVTVTKREDDLLERKACTCTGDVNCSADRYIQIGQEIEIIELDMGARAYFDRVGKDASIHMMG